MLILVFLPILAIVLIIICQTKPTLLGQKGLFGFWDIVIIEVSQGGSTEAAVERPSWNSVYWIALWLIF